MVIATGNSVQVYDLQVDVDKDRDNHCHGVAV